LTGVETARQRLQLFTTGVIPFHTGAVASSYNQPIVRPRLRFRLSPARKLVLGAVLFILLPVLVLGILHFSFLTHLQAGTKAALRENLQQTLQAASAQAQRDMEALGTAVLLPLPGEDSRAKLQQRFARALREHPEIQQIALLQPGHGDCEHCVLYLYTSTGVERFDEQQMRHSMAANQVFVSYHQAFMSAGSSTGSKSEFLFAQHACPVCRAADKSAPLYIFHSTTAPLAGTEHGGFVAMSIDPGYLQRTYLGRLTSNLLGRSDAAQFRPVIAVLDQDRHAIYSSSPEANYAIEASFAPVFPNWRLAIGYQHETLDSLAREAFVRMLLITVVVVMILMGGLLLMFRAAARELKLAEMKSAFVSNVSHELETPLSLIRLLAETLELGRVKDQQKSLEYYRTIHRESCRLTQLINNILDFSRIEAGRNEYRLSPQDLGSTVEDLLSTYQQQIQGEGFELTVKIDRPLPPVLMDGDAISRALLNLVNNAMKYSAETKTIAIHVSCRGPMAAIEVMDRGIGISRADQKRIFEKFYRAGSELVHETKGSGLGLSLVKHIVEAHHGEIKVESAPGKGSTFTILLPVCSPTTVVSGGYELAKNPDC
jgi:signal transduction histidine kinase